MSRGIPEVPANLFARPTPADLERSGRGVREESAQTARLGAALYKSGTMLRQTWRDAWVASDILAGGNAGRAVDRLGRTLPEVEQELVTDIGPMVDATGLYAHFAGQGLGDAGAAGDAHSWLKLHVDERLDVHRRTVAGQAPVDAAARAAGAREQLSAKYGEQEAASLLRRSDAFVKAHPALDKFLSVGALRSDRRVILGLAQHVRSVRFNVGG